MLSEVRFWNPQAWTGINRKCTAMLTRQDCLQRGREGAADPIEISYREKQLILLEELDSLWHCTDTFRAR
jgi:hypothetical protein